MGAADTFVDVPSSKLNATDAALWDIERNPRLRTTIVAALILDRSVEPDRLALTLDAASRRFPKLRTRVVGPPGGIGVPRWEIDDRFDVDEHVEVVRLDVVDDEAIAAHAEPLAGTPFDRDRPLWRCVALLADDDGPSAVLLKVHHSFTDGVGGIGLLDEILDASADAPAPSLAGLAIPRHASGHRDDGDASTFVQAVGAPFRIASAAVTATYHPRRVATASWKGARSAARILAPSAAPRSPLMVGRSTDRRAATADLDLDRLHAAAAAHGCTVNHAFVAGTLSGLSEYHLRHGTPADDLRVTMPVSVRRTGHAATGNQWAPVRFVAPLDAPGAVARMVGLRDLLDARRREPALGFSQTLSGVVQRLPSVVSSQIVAGMMHGVDVTITNVPGLRHRAYLAGAEVDRMYAFAPTGGAALNVALVSHLDTACLGLLADAAAVDDIGLLRDLVAAELTRLVDEALATG